MVTIESVQQFDDLRSANPLLMVKFQADWCPDCRRIAKTYADFASLHHNEVVFADVDVDAVPELAQRYGVQGIPTFLLLTDGQVTDRLYSRDAKTAWQVLDFAHRALHGAASR